MSKDFTPAKYPNLTPDYNLPKRFVPLYEKRDKKKNKFIYDFKDLIEIVREENETS